MEEIKEYLVVGCGEMSPEGFKTINKIEVPESLRGEVIIPAVTIKIGDKITITSG